MERIIFMGIAIMAIFVSSCKKEKIQAPMDTNSSPEEQVVAKSDWGYDNTTVKGVLDAAGYQVGGDDDISKYLGYADPDTDGDGIPDYGDNFNCLDAPAVCYVVIRAKKSKNNTTTDLIAAFKNKPYIYENITSYSNDPIENGYVVHIIR